MASSAATCQVCGGSKFEEENGLYYCTVCNTKLEGMVIISHEEEPPQSLALNVNTGSAPEKSKKTTDTGYLWSTYEGFNVVLVAQCKFLVKTLGLPDDVRRVVLALWANYLEKVQVAFVEDQVKLPIRPRKRDIEAFFKKPKSIKRIRYSFPTSRPFIQQSLKSKRVFDPNKVNVQKETFPKTLRPKKNYKKTGREKILKILAFSDGPIDLESLDLPEIAEKDQVQDEEDGGGIFEPEVILSVDDDEDEDSLSSGVVDDEFEVPEARINDYSRSVKSLLSKGQFPLPSKGSNGSSLLNIDRMSMSYTLAFILISFRILKLNIHMCDLVNWVDQGHLPYYGASNYFPESWMQFQFDTRLFSPIFSPSVESLCTTTSNLCKFLKLFPLPEPEKKDLMLKMLYELNLPLDLHLIIFNNDYLFEKFKSLMITNEKRLLALPIFEVNVLMVILIILRKFYFIDDQDRLVQQCLGSYTFTQTKNRFEPHLWIEYTRIRVKALRLHYTPLWNERTTEHSDIEVAFQFYQQFASRWKPNITQTYRSKHYGEGAFRSKMKQLIWSGTIQDDGKIVFPRPSFTFLSDATAFAADRVRDDLWRQLLKVNFRRKNVSYLKRKQFILPYEPILRKNSTEIPAFVCDYLQLVSWMVHLEKSKLLDHLRSVEKHFFPHHLKGNSTIEPRAKNVI